MAKAEGSGSWFFHESLDEGEGFEMKRLVEEAEAAAITEKSDSKSFPFPFWELMMVGTKSRSRGVGWRPGNWKMRRLYGGIRGSRGWGDASVSKGVSEL